MTETNQIQGEDDMGAIKKVFDRLANLITDNSKLKVQVDDLSVRFNDLRQDFDKVRQELNETKYALEQTKAERDQLVIQRTELDFTIQRKDDRISSLNELVNDQAQTIGELKRSNADNMAQAEATQATLRTEVDKVTKDYTESQEWAGKLDAELVNERRRAETAEQQVNDLQSELSEARRKVETLTYNVTQRQAEIDSLNHRMEGIIKERDASHDVIWEVAQVLNRKGWNVSQPSIEHQPQAQIEAPKTEAA